MKPQQRAFSKRIAPKRTESRVTTGTMAVAARVKLKNLFHQQILFIYEIRSMESHLRSCCAKKAMPISIRITMIMIMIVILITITIVIVIIMITAIIIITIIIIICLWDERKSSPLVKQSPGQTRSPFNYELNDFDNRFEILLIMIADEFDKIKSGQFWVLSHLCRSGGRQGNMRSVGFALFPTRLGWKMGRCLFW